MSRESSLWMGDIEPWMNRDIIFNAFLEYGLKPSSIKMIKDHKYNISKNYCFINFETMAEANKALINLNGKKIPKTNITFRLNWANKHCEMNRNLYVGNLPKDFDDIQLFNIFKERYPSVHHASIMTDNGESKGYGFIQFTEKYDYERCLKEMDGYLIKGRPIIVRERKKKKIEEKDGNNLYNIYKYNKLNNHMNNGSKNVFKNKNNINQDMNNINLLNNNLKENNGYFYKYNNNNKINPLLFQQEEIIKDYNNEEDEDLSSSISNTSDSEKRKFSDNLDLILNDDHNALNKKIQESVDKMFEHYKYISKNYEEFNMIIYYGSNKCSFSEDFYF